MNLSGTLLNEKTVKMLASKLLSEVRAGRSSHGRIVFADHDYVVTIQRVDHRKPSWLHRLLKKGL